VGVTVEAGNPGLSRKRQSMVDLTSTEANNFCALCSDPTAIVQPAAADRATPAGPAGVMLAVTCYL